MFEKKLSIQNLINDEWTTLTKQQGYNYHLISLQFKVITLIKNIKHVKYIQIFQKMPLVNNNLLT